jgi:hypothetical protein
VSKRQSRKARQLRNFKRGPAAPPSPKPVILRLFEALERNLKDLRVLSRSPNLPKSTRAQRNLGASLKLVYARGTRTIRRLRNIGLFLQGRIKVFKRAARKIVEGQGTIGPKNRWFTAGAT